MNDFSVIDLDGHVMEPQEAWLDHLDPAHHADAPRVVVDNQGRHRHLIAGELEAPIPAPAEGWPVVAGGFDAKIRLADMDRQGVQQSLLFPTVGLYFQGLAQTPAQTALCRAYNDWLHDFRAADRQRLLGVAVIPQTDIAESVAEAKRAVRELGCSAVMLRPNPIAGRNLDDPAYTPLWECLEALNVPAAIHEGTTQDLPQSGRDRFDNFLYRHACSHPHEQQMACLALTCGGVLERHPGLRALFLESGCGWIAHWLERLDEHAESWGHANAPLPRAPSEAFARQCFISTDPAERSLPAMLSLVGDETIVFASDYPHPDALADGIVEAVSEREGLSPQNIRRVLHDNAARCLAID